MPLPTSAGLQPPELTSQSPSRNLGVTQSDMQAKGSPRLCAEEKGLQLSWDVKNGN